MFAAPRRREGASAPPCEGERGMKQLLERAMTELVIILLVGRYLVVVELVLVLCVGFRVFVVVSVLGRVLRLLLDWFKRGKDYVRASRSNYVFHAVIDVTAIIVVGWFYLLPRHPILWLAVPFIAISIPLVRSRIRIGRLYRLPPA